MSRTDHARPRRHHGHRTAVHHVQMYGGGTGHQSRCSCGMCGPVRDTWPHAQADGREHIMQTATAEGLLRGAAKP